DIYTPRDRFIPAYFKAADSLLFLIDELNLPVEERSGINNMDEDIREKIENLYADDFDPVIANARLKVMADYIIMNLGKGDELVKEMFGDLNGMEAVEYALGKSKIKNPADLKLLAQASVEEIVNFDGPFIKFAKAKKAEMDDLQVKQEEIEQTEEVNENLLGELQFAVFGTVFPPDANMTIRISDGVLKGFEYNGTIAPVKATFYGMYDRYYANDGEYPWNLLADWQTPPSEFDMSVEFNFVSTHDIVGGNSGSAVINEKAEAVGLAFDGNIVSSVGNTIFVPEENRCVSVATMGMLEAFKYIYKIYRMVEELETGKLTK
ncbi:S46 family peptidase, partial [Bacteroidota bacterium]